MKNAIFFDFDGILAELNSAKVAWSIGPLKFIKTLSVSSGATERIMFDFLESIEARNTATPLLTSAKGNVLPYLLVMYLQGLYSSDYIKITIANAITKLKPNTKQACMLHLLKAITDFIFTPERLCAAYQPIQAGVALFKTCCTTRNLDGSKKNRVFIITNFDAESFKIITARSDFAQLFELSDGVIVSGNVNIVKPDPAIFLYAFEKYAIDPSNTQVVYIDDTQENIASMANLHLPHFLAIHTRAKGMKKVRHLLENSNIL